MNQTFAPRHNTHHFYFLRGLLVCGSCGHTLQGRQQNGRVYYYCEQGGKARYPTVPLHRRHLAGRILEPLVWEVIAALLNQPERIAQVWEVEAAKPRLRPMRRAGYVETFPRNNEPQSTADTLNGMAPIQYAPAKVH